MRKPRWFWKEKANQIQFFDGLMKQLGYKSMDDWYKVTVEDIHKNGGSRLLHAYYNGSPSAALLNVYPEHTWELKRFQNKPSQLRQKSDIQRKLFLDRTGLEKVSNGFWKRDENHKKFF